MLPIAVFLSSKSFAVINDLNERLDKKSDVSTHLGSVFVLPPIRVTILRSGLFSISRCSFKLWINKNLALKIFKIRNKNRTNFEISYKKCENLWNFSFFRKMEL